METLLEELKRYVGFLDEDARVLGGLGPKLSPDFERIAAVFYERILSHDEARKALVEGESQVGRLKVTLVRWMRELFEGPYDQGYYERRARIGRVHVRISLPQHYMFGAMNVVRLELSEVLTRTLSADAAALAAAHRSLGKILDLELAIMLHTYREDLLAQAARSERLSTFGQLVGSIGHELRNPLGVMETSLFILKERVGEDPRGVKHVERIGQQLQLANDIVTQLLDMIRDRPLVRQRLALAPLVDEVVQSLQLPAEVTLEVEGVDGAPELDADPTQLRQVLVNLLQNAADAVRPTGRVRLGARAEGEQLELTVDDSGPGIDPAIRARLFEPLVTTKPKGIGLGLALVRRIVERHGGTIQAASGPLGGARFTVRLPWRIPS